MTDTNKTRKMKNIQNIVRLPQGYSQKEALKAQANEYADQYGYGADTYAHNYAVQALASKRHKSIPFDCNQKERCDRMKQRLREKLANKK
jgi:hypothetical protein